MGFTAIDLIEAKRNGGRLSGDAIDWLISSYTDGSIPDYQMSAMAMAIFFQGLDDEELTAWTAAMLNSGDTMNFDHISAPKVDKHSTGGVGDKISIPLAPLVAACGVAIPMVSGRGLGHTGGTLDKLDSIPGFTAELDEARFDEILEKHGLVIAAASSTVVPADRKLYALRDATATVSSIPLIASSIMSKKLAEGLEGLVLDVKTGSGAFIPEIERARRLAETMVTIGESHDVSTVALLTSMDQPLGREIGNANEIRESVEVLRGEGPKDVTELTLTLGEVMLELAGIEGGRDLLDETIVSGRALQKLIDVAEAHGGDGAAVEDPSLLPKAEHSEIVTAPRAGYVRRCDAHVIGITATRLGAGRERKGEDVDHSVGITLAAKIGARVEEGDVLATVHHNSPEKWESHKEALTSAWDISDEETDGLSLVIERIDASTI
jgi:pyrimidine-nucleoside phosphorylase